MHEDMEPLFANPIMYKEKNCNVMLTKIWDLLHVVMILTSGT